MSVFCFHFCSMWRDDTTKQERVPNATRSRKNNEQKPVMSLHPKGKKALTRHHRNLVMQRRFGPKERVDLFRDRAFAEPLDERVEEQPGFV
jgi:hypothetical protein